MLHGKIQKKKEIKKFVDSEKILIIHHHQNHHLHQKRNQKFSQI